MNLRAALNRTFAAAALVASASSVAAAQAAEVLGCYRFDRPLGSSASGALERTDSTWYTLQLLPDGRVARPALASAYWREQYAHASSWSARGDTIRIRVSTGLVGWDLTLARDAARWRGTARYLSDALGGSPTIATVSAVPEPCRVKPLDPP